MSAVVEVRFKGNRREYYTWSGDLPPATGEAVIVEAERGQDLGRVGVVGDPAVKKCARACDGCGTAEDVAHKAKRRILRRAQPDEVSAAEQLREQEEDVRRKTRDRVREHGLPMKVSDAEWQWDRHKLTVYFTADQRVDFRALVRDLAGLFRARIELRQIGARDEARRLDGIGRCGRQLCIAAWLPEGRPVSLALAKDQGLSLNPGQISGPCGRLLCCLHYEHDFYVESRRRYPKEGKVVPTATGPARVLAVDIFRGRVTLRSESGETRVLSLAELDQPSPPPAEAAGGARGRRRGH